MEKGAMPVRDVKLQHEVQIFLEFDFVLNHENRLGKKQHKPQGPAF